VEVLYGWTTRWVERRSIQYDMTHVKLVRERKFLWQFFQVNMFQTKGVEEVY
jgi:hypothetical protein